MAFYFATVFIFITFLSISKTTSSKYASVLYDAESRKLHIEQDHIQGAVAWGRFSNQVNETGWSFFEVHTNNDFSDEIQSRAAGMVEGFLTADFIWMHWKNMLADHCTKREEECQKVKLFLDENSIFIANSIDANQQDEYWYQVKLVYEQFHGLQEGYKTTTTGTAHPLSYFDFTLMEYLGGLQELELATMNRTTEDYGWTPCSALVKVLPNNTDLFISHATWTDYTLMLRIYKLYDLQLLHSSNPKFHIKAQKHSFSSYPGTLLSVDDFYMLSSGLVVQETTNFNYNPDLWQYVTINTVAQWVRTAVANRLADNGTDWVSLFEKYNDGIYNNQWMVLDYNKFTPGKPLIPGTLWVLEQLPGTIEMADMTDHLKSNGYWASYNVPYFAIIYNKSGFPAQAKKFGPFFDHEKAARAQIFKRDQGKVVDLASMLKIMRYNDYKNDPLSKCNCTPPYSATNAIAARADLNLANGTYPAIEIMQHVSGGATDCKITNYKMFKNFTTLAVSGPTFDQQPVFQWSTSGWSRPLGHPDKWDFKPVMVHWDGDMKSGLNKLLV